MSVKLWERVREIGRVSKASSKRRLVLAALLGAALLPMCSGCSAFTAANNSWTYNRQWNDKMLRDKHVVAAKRAWNARSSCFQNQKHVKDFARGFRAGYMDVADGGTGCVPSFPPREYWGWRYQSCEGQAKVSAWFSGFPHGVRAAEEDGIGNYYQMQTSAGIQRQRLFLDDHRETRTNGTKRWSLSTPSSINRKVPSKPKKVACRCPVSTLK